MRERPNRTHCQRRPAKTSDAASSRADPRKPRAGTLYGDWEIGHWLPLESSGVNLRLDRGCIEALLQEPAPEPSVELTR